MPRHDDELQRIVRDRLHAVAGPRPYRPGLRDGGGVPDDPPDDDAAPAVEPTAGPPPERHARHRAGVPVPASTDRPRPAPTDAASEVAGDLVADDVVERGVEAPGVARGVHPDTALRAPQGLAGRSPVPLGPQLASPDAPTSSPWHPVPAPAPPAVPPWPPVAAADGMPASDAGGGRPAERVPGVLDHDAAARPQQPLAIGDGRDESRPGTAAPLRAPGGDVHDVVRRLRAEALGAAATARLDRPVEDDEQHRGDDRRPGTRTAGQRWDLSTRHAVVAAVAVTLLAAGVMVRAGLAVPDPEPAPAAPAAAVGGTPDRAPTGTAVGTAGAAPGPAATSRAAAGAPSTPSSGADPATAVVVHVVGQVGAPGIVELAPGSRVSDALAAAGGAAPTADLSAVNLARVVQDGEQILVPAPGEPATAPGPPGPPADGGAGPSSTTPEPAAPIDLNAADVPALDALPGIGPVLAQRIVDWRTENGPFRDVEELAEVAGIGPAVLGRLRPLVRV